MSNIVTRGYHSPAPPTTTNYIAKHVNMDFPFYKIKPFASLIYLEGNPETRFLEIAKGIWLDTITGEPINKGSNESCLIKLTAKTLEDMAYEVKMKLQDMCYLKIVNIGKNAFHQEGIDDGKENAKIGDYVYTERCHAQPWYDVHGAMTNFFTINDTKCRGFITKENYEFEYNKGK